MPVEYLKSARVERIDGDEAAEFIRTFEYLGTAWHRAHAYGVRGPDGSLLGVELFGRPGGTRSLTHVLGDEYADKVIALERGACVPDVSIEGGWAPVGINSWLIKRALIQAHRDNGWVCVVAYSDERAGEYGCLYQMLGWSYLGQGVGRKGDRREFTKDGVTVTSQAINKRYPGKGGWARAAADGWVSSKTVSKHKYAKFLGPEADRWRELARTRLPGERFPDPPKSLSI